MFRSFLTVVTLKHLEAPTIRGDVARLCNAQLPFSDLPSCHPVTSQAAQDKTRQKTSRNETTSSLEISWQMPGSVAADVSWQLRGLFGLCKELLGGKAQSFKSEKWWDLDNLQHLPPPLEHSPTLRNSNNTKQYNTYIQQSTRQSTKQSRKNIPRSTVQKQTSKNDNTEQPTNSNKGKQQTQANKAPPSSTTYLLQLTQQNPNNKIQNPQRYGKSGVAWGRLRQLKAFYTFIRPLATSSKLLQTTVTGDHLTVDP